MEDSTVLSRIDELVAEEHAILGREGSGHAKDDDHQRLRAVQTTLDQCWDLLRQRRALRETGNDPGLARTRSEATVERYEQ